MAWLLLKDTVNSCIEYRILGLAAEAAFFTLLSLPPLLLSLIALLGYVDGWTNTDTVATINKNIINAAQSVLSDRGVHDFAEPLLADVTKGNGRKSSPSASPSRSGRARGPSTSSSTPSP